MLICRVRLHNTSKSLTFRMSGKQICLQLPPKLFGVNSWISQIIRHWIPDCRYGDRKCMGPNSAGKLVQGWYSWHTFVKYLHTLYTNFLATHKFKLEW